MKTVKIHFLDAGIGIFDYDIIVSDNQGNIYFDGKTKNGKVCFCAPSNTFLNIMVCSFRGRLYKGIYLGCNNLDVALFYDKRKRKPVNFTLTDKYYKNLQIMKGELFLWTNTL